VWAASEEGRRIGVIEMKCMRAMYEVNIMDRDYG
jgi:hypothetical protein